MSLQKIQEELKVPKGNFNEFGNYKYRSCEDILEAVKPLLAKYNDGLILRDEIVEISGRFYVKATAIFKENDNEIIVTAFAREDESKKKMDGSQVTGTASSYARKYALNGLFLIDDTKDADTDEYRKQQEEPKQGKGSNEKMPEKSTDKITAGGVDFLNNLCKEVDSFPAAVCDYFKIETFADMTLEQFNKATKMLESKRK